MREEIIMKSRKNTKRILLALVVLIIVTLACATLEVENTSDIPVRINVHMSGGSGSNYLLLEGKESEYFFSEFSGPYSVSVIADESYREMLTMVRDSLIKTFQAKSGVASAEEIEKVVKDIEKVNTSLANIGRVSCSGTLQNDGDSTVYIDYDTSNGDWSLKCVDE